MTVRLEVNKTYLQYSSEIRWKIFGQDSSGNYHAELAYRLADAGGLPDNWSNFRVYDKNGRAISPKHLKDNPYAVLVKEYIAPKIYKYDVVWAKAKSGSKVLPFLMAHREILSKAWEELSRETITYEEKQ